MAQRIINPDVVLTLTNDEFSALNAFLAQVSESPREDLYNRLPAENGWYLAKNHLDELHALWARIHGNTQK